VRGQSSLYTQVLLTLAKITRVLTVQGVVTVRDGETVMPRPIGRLLGCVRAEIQR
jgi:hypothetical protein